MRKVWLWDIPGAGTTAHPSKSYIGDYNIMAFDMMIIANCGRITGQICLLWSACMKAGLLNKNWVLHQCAEGAAWEPEGGRYFLD